MTRTAWLCISSACLLLTAKERSNHPICLSPLLTVASIQTKVNETLAKMESLRFEANLKRLVKDREETEYLAFVQMKIGKVETRVFDSNNLSRPIVEIKAQADGMDDEGHVIFTQVYKPDNHRVVSCLLGSVETSWIGPANTAVHPFDEWLGKGTFVGQIETDEPGHSCYQINYERLLAFNKQKYRRVEIYCVDTKTFLVRRWDSEEYDLPQNELVMATSRRYSIAAVEPPNLQSKGEDRDAQKNRD